MSVGKRVFASSLAIAMSLALASSLAVGVASADSMHVAVQASGSHALATQSKAGWVTTASGKAYYRNGSKVTGLQKIGKSRYYFNSKGVLKTSDVKVGEATYYVDANGKLIGAKLGSKNHYDTLKPMSKADSYDFDTYLQARAIVKRVTSASDSKETKLHKAFDWVMGKTYGIHRTFNPFDANWTAVYARDHFNDRGGDCHADAAAFAYLAAAIGYPADVCLDAVTVGTPGSHSWCMIGNKVYDPLFAQSKSYAGYYGATSGTYEVNPTARYRVPRFNPKNAPAGAKASVKLSNAGLNGLKKVGKFYCYYKSGVKLKNAWKTVSGKRYYFKGNGHAATLSAKVKGAYYVFGKKGVLQNSKKAGTRVVKIGSESYQVNKKGRAVSGWSSDGTRRFDKTGLLLCGVRLVDGELYAADSVGVYQRETTEALKAAAVRDKPVAKLVSILGSPKADPVVSVNCDKGYDIIRAYKSFNVISWQLDNPADVGYIVEGENAELFKSVAAA